jgi:hypothetical protein
MAFTVMSKSETLAIDILELSLFVSIR